MQPLPANPSPPSAVASRNEDEDSGRVRAESPTTANPAVEPTEELSKGFGDRAASDGGESTGENAVGGDDCASSTKDSLAEFLDADHSGTGSEANSIGSYSHPFGGDSAADDYDDAARSRTSDASVTQYSNSFTDMSTFDASTAYSPYSTAHSRYDFTGSVRSNSPYSMGRESTTHSRYSTGSVRSDRCKANASKARSSAGHSIALEEGYGDICDNFTDCAPSTRAAASSSSPRTTATSASGITRAGSSSEAARDIIKSTRKKVTGILATPPRSRTLPSRTRNDDMHAPLKPCPSLVRANSAKSSREEAQEMLLKNIALVDAIASGKFVREDSMQEGSVSAGSTKTVLADTITTVSMASSSMSSGGSFEEDGMIETTSVYSATRTEAVLVTEARREDSDGNGIIRRGLELTEEVHARKESDKSPVPEEDGGEVVEEVLIDRVLERSASSAPEEEGEEVVEEVQIQRDSERSTSKIQNAEECEVNRSGRPPLGRVRTSPPKLLPSLSLNTSASGTLDKSHRAIRASASGAFDSTHRKIRGSASGTLDRVSSFASAASGKNHQRLRGSASGTLDRVSSLLTTSASGNLDDGRSIRSALSFSRKPSKRFFAKSKKLSKESENKELDIDELVPQVSVIEESLAEDESEIEVAYGSPPSSPLKSTAKDETKGPAPREGLKCESIDTDDTENVTVESGGWAEGEAGRANDFSLGGEEDDGFNVEVVQDDDIARIGYYKNGRFTLDIPEEEAAADDSGDGSMLQGLLPCGEATCRSEYDNQSAVGEESSTLLQEAGVDELLDVEILEDGGGMTIIGNNFGRAAKNFFSQEPRSEEVNGSVDISDHVQKIGATIANSIRGICVSDNEVTQKATSSANHGHNDAKAAPCEVALQTEAAVLPGVEVLSENGKDDVVVDPSSSANIDKITTPHEIEKMSSKSALPNSTKNGGVQVKSILKRLRKIKKNDKKNKSKKEVHPSEWVGSFYRCS